VDVHTFGNVPNLALPGVMETSTPSMWTLIGEDTPLLRAKLTEFLMANPDCEFSVSQCILGWRKDLQSAQELVCHAFSKVQPPPLSYNVKNAAKRFGVSYSYMRKLIRIGEIKKVRGRVAACELERYFKHKTQIKV